MPDTFILIRSHNDQEYIGHTINAVFSLRFPNPQIIIVDDGSTDNTPQIIQSFEKDYPSRILLVQQENGGPGKAIQALIQTASKYMKDEDTAIFLDSDDLLLPPIREVPEKLEKADVCYIPFRMSGETNYTSNSHIRHNNFTQEISSKVQNIAYISTRKIATESGFGYPFKAVAGHILKKFNLMALPYFPKSAHYAEDIPSILFCLFKGTRITGLQEDGYNYIRRTSSLTGHEDRKTILARFSYLDTVHQVLQRNESNLVHTASNVINSFTMERMLPSLRSRVKLYSETRSDFNYTPSAFERDCCSFFRKLTKQHSQNNFQKVQ